MGEAGNNPSWKCPERRNSVTGVVNTVAYKTWSQLQGEKPIMAEIKVQKRQDPRKAQQKWQCIRIIRPGKLEISELHGSFVSAKNVFVALATAFPNSGC